MEYRLSEIDRERFKYITAKASISDLEDVQTLLDQATKDRVNLIITRILTNKLDVVQALEAKGAFLTDTLIYYQKKKIEPYCDILPSGYTMRLAVPNDAEKIENLAGEAFRGYLGHYHSDPRLMVNDCDLVYSSWAAKSCTDPGVADAMILIENSIGIAAFATLKVNSLREFEGVLFGISPDHQGKGLYISLMKLAQNWGGENGKSRMIVSTQITNTTVQKAWCRLDFEPRMSYYTFHFWLDQNPE